MTNRYGEPWRMGEHHYSKYECDYSEIIKADGRQLDCGLEFFGDGRNETISNRIIACVNACAGIPTEELTKCVIKANFAGADPKKNIIRVEIESILDEAREILQSKGLLLPEA